MVVLVMEFSSSGLKHHAVWLIECVVLSLKESPFIDIF